MKKHAKLPHPDNFHLEAAEGWFELGSLLEANAELENITLGLRAHPQVLKLRCRIYLQLKSWFGVVEIADRLIEAFSDEVEWWQARATALHNLKRTDEAIETLLKAALKFPDVWRVAYNLSCYASSLRRFQSAEKWFKRAILLDEKQTQRLGIDDPDLTPLWDSMSTTIWKKEK